MGTSTNIILATAREHLAMARHGLADMESGDPTRLRPGIMNLCVFGRSTTNVLQNLRSSEPTFDEWYQPKVKAMEADSLMRYFYKKRTEILKEGELGYTNVTSGSLNTNDIAPLWALAPPGTKGMFFGDYLGGDGFVVEMPDGTDVHVYAQFPDVGITTTLEFTDAPTEHDGIPIEDSSVGTLGRMYIEVLERIVEDADRHFGGS